MDVGGRVNVIPRQLIAQGKTKPMVVVMPLHGAPEIVVPGPRASLLSSVRRTRPLHPGLVHEVMPQVEAAYRVPATQLAGRLRARRWGARSPDRAE
jgi:enterochelin esterase-like enzyme